MQCLAQAYFAGWTALIEFPQRPLVRVNHIPTYNYSTTDLDTPLSGLHDIHNSSWALPYIPLGMSADLHLPILSTESLGG